MKEKNTFFIIAIIAIIAIFLSILFLVPKSKPQRETMTHNFFEFEKIAGVWETTIKIDNQLYKGAFRFNPEETRDVYLTGNFTGFKKKPIYITFDPDSTKEQFKYLALATSELSLHVIRALNFTVSAACTKNETLACEDRPIITCNSNESVIYLKSEAPTQITLNNNCITLTGEGMDLLKSVDRLLYQWYRIYRAEALNNTLQNQTNE